MIFTLGQYKIDVDVEKTKEFYSNAKAVSKGCSCDGCLNFEKAVGKLPEEVQKFFADLGVDMTKVCECYVNFKINDGLLSYGGFYHLCGTLQSGEIALEKIGHKTYRRSENSDFAVSPSFEVSFKNEVDLLEKDFPLPVFQLEFFAEIPWVLDKKNEY